MDTSPSGVSQGKSTLATKSCPNFWLLQATQILMKMHLVSACHSSSLVHNQKNKRLQNTAGMHRSCAISKALEMLCTHKLTAQQQVYCFQLDEQTLHNTSALPFIYQILLCFKGSCARHSWMLLLHL